MTTDNIDDAPYTVEQLDYMSAYRIAWAEYRSRQFVPASPAPTGPCESEEIRERIRELRAESRPKL